MKTLSFNLEVINRDFFLILFITSLINFNIKSQTLFKNNEELSKTEKETVIQNIKEKWETRRGRSIDNFVTSAQSDNTVDIKIYPKIKLEIDNVKNTFLDKKYDIAEYFIEPVPFRDKFYSYLREGKNVSLFGKAKSQIMASILKDVKIEEKIYFFYLLEKEKYNIKYTIHFDSKGQYFIDNMSKQFASFSDFINYEYGSFTKLKELLEEENWNLSCKCDVNFMDISLEKVQDLIKSNPILYATYAPKDSLAYTNTLFNLIEKSANLNQNELRLLKQKILDNSMFLLPNLDFRSDNHHIDDFKLGKISYSTWIEQSLTKDQYLSCVKEIRKKNDCTKRAFYFLQRKLSLEHSEKKVIEEINSIFTDTK
jgi:hypothetical protein